MGEEEFEDLKKPKISRSTLCCVLGDHKECVLEAVGFVLDPRGLVRGRSDDGQTSKGTVEAAQSRKGITTADLQLSRREVFI